MDAYLLDRKPRRREILRRRFCIGLLQAMMVVLLPGCASMAPEMQSPAPGAAQVTSSVKAHFFTLRGRISVRFGDRLDSAKIHWMKVPDEERLKLFTPFGSQLAELVKPANGPVTLRQNQQTVTAETIDLLTSSLLGVPLDMDVIAAWTQGVGLIENIPTEQKFGNGDVWQVTAERFQTQGPHRYVSRLSATSGDTTIRLVIDDWNVQ